MPVVLLESKPATEWLFGGPVRKVSPRRTHALLQTTLASALDRWARGRGDVGTEWRFWLQPPGEEARYLVPDVAYVSRERLASETSGDADDDESRFAPDVVFEILSCDDRPANVAHKIDVYLRAGTTLVVIVDPKRRSIRAIDSGGERSYEAGERFEHRAVPGFDLDIERFFARTARP